MTQFPNSPSIGDKVTFNDATYEWDGNRWKSLGTIAVGPTGPTGATGEQVIAKTYDVTVSNPGSGNKYFIDTVQQDTVHLLRGQKYVFSLAAVLMTLVIYTPREL